MRTLRRCGPTRKSKDACARVVSQQRGLTRLAGEFEECWAEPSGVAKGGEGRRLAGRWDLGLGRDASEKQSALIQQVLPRRSGFVRKVAGKQIAEQVIVANIDAALIVAALDRDFNVRRMKLYLAQCWARGRWLC